MNNIINAQPHLGRYFTLSFVNFNNVNIIRAICIMIIGASSFIKSIVDIP